MSSSDQVPRGTYRHYKGQLYRLLDVVRHSETEEAMALYQPLYGDRGLWVRPLAMFLEEVEIDGRRVPRFQHIPDADPDTL